MTTPPIYAPLIERCVPALADDNDGRWDRRRLHASFTLHFRRDIYVDGPARDITGLLVAADVSSHIMLSLSSRIILDIFRAAAFHMIGFLKIFAYTAAFMPHN